MDGNVSRRGDYLNTMFVAAVMDENNHTLSIPFCMGVPNIIDSCTWFLMRLKETLVDTREVLCITNMEDVTTSPLGQKKFCRLTPTACEAVSNITHVKWVRLSHL
uniref:MULE transposase domain-containing protein n=1 Tax=Lactuca sativa TaxID=4236 RepID=A0A9R1XT23_LACSA|nr:hypothetical protein LSAT_V11C100008330 [Lactuca sativa]